MLAATSRKMVSTMVMDSLSALLDGECSAEETDRLLGEIERSPELARQWSRMCLARDARAGVSVPLHQPCICDAVMSRLDPAPAAADAKVVDLAVHKASRSGRQRFTGTAAWKPLIGFAAAASVGAAAVFLLQPQSGTVDPTPSNGIPAAGTLAHWNRGDARAVQPVAVAGDEAHAQMLREYLMDHSSAVAGEGLGSTLRYARFAAHTADYRPEPSEQP